MVDIEQKLIYIKKTQTQPENIQSNELITTVGYVQTCQLTKNMNTCYSLFKVSKYSNECNF